MTLVADTLLELLSLVKQSRMSQRNVVVKLAFADILPIYAPEKYAFNLAKFKFAMLSHYMQ